MVDIRPDLLDNAMQKIQRSLGRKFKKNITESGNTLSEYVNDVLSRIHVTTDVIRAVQQADLVIEAIVENMKLKQTLFSVIDKVTLKMLYIE